MKKNEVISRIKLLRKSKEKDPTENYIISDIRDVLPTGGSSGIEKNKIEFTHKICNNKFKMTYCNFIQGQGCPYCYGNHKKYNYNVVKNLIENENYTLLSKEYINSHEKLKIQDNVNHKIIFISLDDWNSGVRTNRTVFTPQQLANDINKFDSEYISTDYSANHAHDMLEIKHITCNHIFKMQYNNFKNGQRCPICSIKNADGNISKAVKQIINILEEKCIDFELEKKIDDLKVNRKLRYDFYIPSKNLLLEYQGQQHFIYYSTGYFTKEKFDEIQRNDLLKLNYAKINNFNIEYINYNENIDEKLQSILNKY